MDNTFILGRLQQLTGSLKLAPGTSADELSSLQRNLAEQLAADPGFTVSGNRLQHQAAQAEPAVDLSARFSHLSDVFTAPPAAAAAVPSPAPLVFRRETSFSSSLLGNSVPQWGSGMAPSNRPSDPFSMSMACRFGSISFSPPGWSGLLQGSATPVLVIPICGGLTGKKSYSIEAGSAWIASGLIAKDRCSQWLLHRIEDQRRLARSFSCGHD